MTTRPAISKRPVERMMCCVMVWTSRQQRSSTESAATALIPATSCSRSMACAERRTAVTEPRRDGRGSRCRRARRATALPDLVDGLPQDGPGGLIQTLRLTHRDLGLGALGQPALIDAGRNLHDGQFDEAIDHVAGRADGARGQPVPDLRPQRDRLERVDHQALVGAAASTGRSTRPERSRPRTRSRCCPSRACR